MLRITRYADRLLDGSRRARLAGVDAGDAAQLDRPQRGRRGDVHERRRRSPGREIRVFTTRPDTLYGATYMVLSPEHPLVDELTTPAQRAAVDAPIRKRRARKSDLERTDLAKDKTGVFTGATAINPVNGKQIPIWIADYVLASYGTGAIMAVPAHDERDFAFAQEVRPADRPGGHGRADGSTPDAGRSRSPATASNVNSGPLDGLPTPEAKQKITAELEARGVGKGAVSYRLRDWVFSRQRYWGEPIPLVHCPNDGVVPVPEAQLPVRAARRRALRADRHGRVAAGRRSTAWVEHDLPEVRRPGQARDQHDAAVGGLVLVLPALPRPEERRARVRPRRPRSSGWRSTSTSAAPSTRCCTCSTRASGTRCSSTSASCHTKEPFQKLRHQGTVLAVLVPGRDGPLPRARRRRAARRRAPCSRRRARS